MAKKPTKSVGKQHTQRRIDVIGHKRSDPRINKKVNVRPYKREQQFKQFRNLPGDRDLLENIRLPKKYKPTMDKIKEGVFEKQITDSERKLFEQPIKIQKDIYNEPTKDAYQKEFNKIMKRITKISGLGEYEKRLGVLKKSEWNIREDFEASVKHFNDDRKEMELEIYGLEKEIKADPTKKKILEIKIKDLQEKRAKNLEEMFATSDHAIFLKKDELIKKRIKKYREDGERFIFNFIDKVNTELTPMGKGYKELYLDYDLKFVIQKNEKHKFTVDGKEHTANVKVYKFEELDKNTKEKIIKIINKNFKKEYLKDDTEQFLKSFKDQTSKPKKISEQANLDKLIGINTKLYDQYGDMKAFGKSQTRLK